jgi:hypothetical protein
VGGAFSVGERTGSSVVEATNYPKRVTKREQQEAAGILERLAQVVAGGGVSAPSGFVGRLEGAAAALKVMSRAPDRKGQGRRL